MISPSSGMTAPESALISVDLPAPLSPMTPRISLGQQVEIGMVERDDAAVALDEARVAVEDGCRVSLMPKPS